MAGVVMRKYPRLKNLQSHAGRLSELRQHHVF